MKLNKLVLGLMISIAVPAVAHHSFEIEFDSKKTAPISGIVTKLDWINPHAYLYVESKDASGAAKSWRIEMGPPYSLVRGGWKRDTIKIGDKVTVEGAAMAKDGGATAGALATTFLIEAPALTSGKKLPMR